VAAEIGAVDFRFAVRFGVACFTAKRLADFMRQNESRFVLRAKIADLF